MKDQGIMALPQAGMQAPTTAPTQYPAGEAAIAAFEQARAEMNPQEFGNELLSAAEQMEPAAVQEFKRAIEALNLPPEIIDALNQMVDTILAEPEKYDEIRANFIAEGVPEDLLPPTFDPAFFGALNLALDQMAGASMPMITQQFADGGIVSLKPIAKMLAAQGRNGDTMLAHITPTEARLLRRYGGSGTINPITGLPEFFLKKVFKAVGNAISGAVKSVGKAISNTFKSISSAVKKFTSSTIGRIVTTVALGFFLGPAAAGMLGVTSAAGVAAVSGFIGSAGSTLLAGGKLKDALKAGALGGLTAGAMAGVTSGMGAFEAGSYTGPTTVAGQVERFTDSLKSLGGTSGAPAEVTGQLQYSGQGQVLPGSAEIRGTTGFGAADVGAVPGYQYTPTDSLIKPGFDPNLATQATGDNIFRMPPSVANAPGAGVQVAGNAQGIGPVPGTPPAPGAPSYLGMDLSSAQGAVGGPSYAGMDLSSAQGAVGGPSYAGMDLSSAEGAIDIPNRSFMDTARGAYDKYIRPYTPGGIEETGRADALNAAKAARADAVSAGFSSDAADKLALQAYNKALPGTFAKYAPIVAAGTGLAYAAGAFNPTEPKPPGIVPRTTGFDLYNQNPTQYGVTPGGASTVYAPSSADYGVMGNPFMRPTFQVRDPREYLSPYGLASLAPRRFNTGGFAAGGIGSMARKYPRRTGQISGPGTETSDSIPAMLSDGEFVMTAKAVRGAGNGSRREGAKRMYQMMRKFERKA